MKNILFLKILIFRLNRLMFYRLMILSTMPDSQDALKNESN
ncbi:MAG: hypothetical protein RSB52_04390 [Acidaminococcaceae bacterium]